MTHLDAEESANLFAMVARALHPGGVGIFSTHGTRSVELIKRGETYGLDEDGLSRLLAGWRPVCFLEHGGDNHQDVHGFVRE